MRTLIAAAFSRSRTVLLLLALTLIVGAFSYIAIPKESSPDIPIPIVYVSVAYEGIAPEDAERLLVRPLEIELQALEGLDEMRAVAAQGYANVTLEFEAGYDTDQALDDVREAVDRAEPELPDGAETPIVQEVNLALFPILTVVMSGPLPERSLVDLARDLSDRIETLPGVLEVDIGGDREEVLEVLVDPVVLETYNVSFDELINQVQRNNRLIAAGALDTGAGRLVLEVPGVIEDLRDVMELPVKVSGSTVVTFGDVATIRRTYRDPTGFARIDGQPAVALEVRKRVGANIIETVEGVRGLVDQMEPHWPGSLDVSYLQDESEQVKTTLSDLQNNVLAAIILVMLVILVALGPRPSILVGLSIPGSFLAALAILYAFGVTLNILVLFSLILVVGMLVDGAIVTVELADRAMADGRSRKDAYRYGAERMAWPIIASTATTLAVFVPLLFWGGMVGEFMKFLPITVIVTLTASLFMALVFVPVLGGLIGKRGALTPAAENALRAAEGGDLSKIGGFTGRYLRLLGRLLRRPGLTLLAALAILIGTYVAYGQFGRGVEFFPEIEPEFAQVQIRARDNLSIWERDALVRRVENRLLDMSEIEKIYARTIGEGQGSSGDLGQDVIGTLQLDLADWQLRRPAAEIIEDVRQHTADLPGIQIVVREQQQGPSQGKPVQLQVRAADSSTLDPAVDQIRSIMNAVGGFADVEDTRPPPGIRWRLEVDRAQAARYGADVTLLGNMVQLVTNGIEVADYRPEDADDEVEIRVRFPYSERTLARLEQLRVETANGLVPIQNFVDFVPSPLTGTIRRIDAQRTVTVDANVAEGALVSERIQALSRALAEANLSAGTTFSFAGEAEDQAESAAFLVQAFGAAIFLMVTILVTQFNSIYQAILVMSAIIFSTAGVLLGLLVLGRPFGVVMGGIGVIALAGIVVNNNIVLIDTFNDLRAQGYEPKEAALRTGAQRLRPVLLTSITTVLGLVPMVMGLTVDVIGADLTFGAPSTQWWTELSTAIAGGLTVATLLTLILTPCLLVLQGPRWWRRRRERRAGRRAA